MFQKYAPPECKQVKKALKKMGFSEPDKKGSTSHEHYTKIVAGKLFKVTVDCPKAPFGDILMVSMSNQAGVSKKTFLYYCHAKKAKGEPSEHTKLQKKYEKFQEKLKTRTSS